MTYRDFCGRKEAFSPERSAAEATLLASWVENAFAHHPGLYPLLLTPPRVGYKSKIKVFVENYRGGTCLLTESLQASYHLAYNSV